MDTLRDRITHFLSERTTVTLATVNDASEPFAAAVFFAHDDKLNLYFLAAKTTHHGANMLAQPRIAVTIQADNQSPATLMGLQMHGTARPVTALQLPRAAALYARKFAFANIADLTRKDAISAALSASTFWKFEPDWARLIDNSRGFGHHEEMDFSDEAEVRRNEEQRNETLAETLEAAKKPQEDICHRRRGTQASSL